jgi:type IV secretion system protein VirB11
VAWRENILIGGGGGGGSGSGKTTLANALLAEIAETSDRVYLVEDNPELQCLAQNKVQVLVQPPVYTWRRAIMDAMRFRPDRIIVGEVRDGRGLEHRSPRGHRHLPRQRHLGHARPNVPAHGAALPVAPKHLIVDTITVCVHIQRDPDNPAGRSLSGIDMLEGLTASGAWDLSPLG